MSGRRYFKEIVVNIGRQAGTSLADIAHYLERDSTYGALHAFLHGYRCRTGDRSDIDENRRDHGDRRHHRAFSEGCPNPPGHRLESA